MKKFKLVLVSSALAISFLSNPVNAMEPDEDVSGSKSASITILDLDAHSTSKILMDLPLRDVASFALTSKNARQVPYRPIWFQTDGQYKYDLVSFHKWSLMLSPFVAAARHQKDHDQRIKQDSLIYGNATQHCPGSLDLRLAIMDNLPSFHGDKDFTFQINGKQWRTSYITFFNDESAGYVNVGNDMLVAGEKLTMANVLNILTKRLNYNASNSNPKEGLAQFGEGGSNWGSVYVSIVE